MKRHDWIYPDRDARPRFAGADATALAFAHEWIARGRPLVVTRQSCDAATLSLGLALPPGHAARRLACTLDRAAVRRHRGPLTADEAAPVLHEHDAQALRRLASALLMHGTVVGVYGSTAWQCVSGLAYRHEGSDVDVVCDVAQASALDACIAALEHAARDLRSRLDGEIRFADGRAVAWRELAQARAASTGVVLAKGERDVALLPWRDLLVPAQ